MSSQQVVGGVGDASQEAAAPGTAPLGTLSPSRAGDFLSCPLLYRFRSVDRLPEPVSLDALRGTVVHRVLEQLYDLPAPQRTPERAGALVPGAWAEILTQEPEAQEGFADDAAREAWLATCETSVRRYFDLEDPTRLEPADRELYVETLLESKLLVRGIVDRVDVAADGAIRVVDYKTGRAPGVGWEAKALFQLRIYALALWRERGVLPAMLQLLYLGDGQVIRYEPDAQSLMATERKLEAVWRAIATAHETGEFLPHRSGLCGWCAHQAICPAWGGTPPPLPDSLVSRPVSGPVTSPGGPPPPAP
ncbi:PD-(D/E)XK nuclease family protein [Nocardioides nanhaiensis]|uniref:RecB family exonuclease n=1 Tax=Nocardioides nanhaiensis TaxID=1476871 RepID=A0ABP8WPF2_9ACTN